MDINSVNQLIEHSIQDIYSAEHQLVKALTELSANATSPELKEALDVHKQETEGHISRIEQACVFLEVDPNGEDCIGIKGIIEEGKKLLEKIELSKIKDMAIISGGQKSEHYEMAVYEDLIMNLELLNKTDAADLLSQNLEEEKNASDKLAEIAEMNNEIEGIEEDDSSETLL